MGEPSKRITKGSEGKSPGSVALVVFVIGEGDDVDRAPGVDATTAAVGPNVGRAPGTKSKLMALKAGLSGDEWMGV